MKLFNRKINQAGFSILEVLIAAVITSIIATSAFQFYTKMHEQSEHQFNVSEMHQLARTSMYDIKNSLMQLQSHLDYLRSYRHLMPVLS